MDGNTYSQSNVQQDTDAYEMLFSYIKRSHEICKLVIKIGIISFVAFPIVLLVMIKITSGDKVVALIIWIVFMFVLALVLILVGFFDRRLQHALKEVVGEYYSFGKLKIINNENLDKIILQNEEKIENLEDRIAESFHQMTEYIYSEVKEIKDAKDKKDAEDNTDLSINSDELSLERILSEMDNTDSDMT